MALPVTSSRGFKRTLWGLAILMVVGVGLRNVMLRERQEHAIVTPQVSNEKRVSCDYSAAQVGIRAITEGGILYRVNVGTAETYPVVQVDSGWYASSIDDKRVIDAALQCLRTGINGQRSRFTYEDFRTGKTVAYSNEQSLELK